MKLERILQIAIVTMVSMSALLLATGQQNRWLAVLGIFVGVTSLYFNDYRGILRLPTAASNVCATLAVAVCVGDLAMREEDARILAIANLLVYLQCILLYQKKTERNYWQIVALSLLQVVVASVLSLGMEYGFLLALYSLLAMAAVVLLVIFHECMEFAPDTQLTTAPTGLVTARQPGGNGERLTSSFELGVSPVPDDRVHSMLNGSLLRHLAFVGVASVAVGITIFFMFPRFRDAAWRTQMGEEVQRLTGFSDEISLNDMGTLLESPELVMRVWLYDRETKQPYILISDPYFRGTVLDRYSNGRWLQARFRGRPSFTVDAQPRALGEMVRMEIALQPQRSFSLFCIAPSYQISTTPRAVRWDPFTNLMERNPRESRANEKITYAFDTAGFVQGRQVNIVPVGEDYMPGGQRMFGRRPLNTSNTQLELDISDLASLETEVDRILTETSASRDDPYDCAKSLERYLLILGGFKHSLTAVERDPSQDPVVGFLQSDEKTGHCEYFASALCLMLRSLEIPSRVVVGYKGAEFNSVGNFYQVRQLNTHAWVEAYFASAELPRSVRLAEDAKYGAWLRLDPTPVASDDEISEGQTFMERIREYRDYVQLVWNDYILGLDSKRQRESVYLPIKAWVLAVLSPESWAYFLRNFSNEIANMIRGREFGWRAGLFVMFLGTTCVFLLAFVRRLTRYVFSKLRPHRQRTSGQSRHVEFYRRCEKLLERKGFLRQASQTPREFSRQVTQAVAHDEGAISAIERIVDAFYRVRFGGQQLAPRQMQSLESTLLDLESRLSLDAGIDKSREPAV